MVKKTDALVGMTRSVSYLTPLDLAWQTAPCAEQCGAVRQTSLEHLPDEEEGTACDLMELLSP